MINKSILLILPAVDFNEQEYLVVYNTLITKGYKVFIASDAHTICIGKNGLKVKNDVNFFNMREANFGGLVFIGGTGVKNYWDNLPLQLLAKNFHQSKKIIGAICSSPIIIARGGLLSGINATCFPEDRRELERSGAVYVDSPVAVSRNIITAQGPQAAQEFVNSFINELVKS